MRGLVVAGIISDHIFDSLLKGGIAMRLRTGVREKWIYEKIKLYTSLNYQAGNRLSRFSGRLFHFWTAFNRSTR